MVLRQLLKGEPEVREMKKRREALKQTSRQVLDVSVLPICLSRSAASSAVALGSTPGSLKLVLSRVPSTNMKSTPPITGMTGVNCTAKKGQLVGRRKRKDSVSGSQGFCLSASGRLCNQT